MKNKIIPLVAMYVIVILFVICVLTVITEDRDAPEIIFGEEDIVYVQGEDINQLLTGVSAIDKVDGDVSNTLTIEGVNVLLGSRKVNIIYAARDTYNNIVKSSRIVKYQELEASSNPTEIPEDIDQSIEESDIATEDVNSEVTNSVEELEENPDAEQPNEVTPAEETEEDSEDTEPLVSTGDPIIKLNTYSVTIEAGANFNYMNYIKEAVDDKDDAWRRIYINGNYSTKVPGEYSLRYSITDSDGNHSNVETLVLIVQ